MPDGAIREPVTFRDDYANRSTAAEPGTDADDGPRARGRQGDRRRAGSSARSCDSWLYQRYIKDYLRCVASIDDNVGRLLDYLDAEAPERRHGRRLHLRPGLLPRRPRLVRQALHVRGVAPDAVARALPARDAARLGLRRARRSTSTSPRRCSTWPTSRPRPGCRAAASRGLLRGEPPPTGAGPCTTATGCTTTAATASRRHYGVRTERHKLIYYYNDGLGQPGASDRFPTGVGAVRPRVRSPRAAQRLRRPGLRTSARRTDPRAAPPATGDR